MPRLLTLRVLAWRWRRVLRAALVAVLVGLAVRLTAPPAAPAAPVAVAARPVTAGHVLTADDVRLARLPSTGVPAAAARSVEPLIGRRAAVDLPAGLVLVPSLLASGRFAVDPPAGTVVVPVAIGGSASLRVGDAIEVVADAGCPGSVEPVAVAARVIAVGDLSGAPTGLADGGSALGPGLGIGTGGSSGADGLGSEGSVLLAVAPESGRRLAGVAQSCSLAAVIVP